MRDISAIEGYFAADSKKADSDKIFSKISHEYIDLTNGFKITLYDSKKYDEYVKSYYKDKDAKQSGL